MNKFTIVRSTLFVLLSVLVNAGLFAQLPETFTNTAHIDNGGSAKGVAFGADATVFLANDSDGLRAYTYDGSSFSLTAHIDNGAQALKVAVGADGTVFLANYTDGLRAYTYDGSSFSLTAHIDNGGYAAGVAVGADGTVFTSNFTDGLRAYTYDGSSFTNTAHIDDGGSANGVAVGADGTVFLANWDDGLRAYTYDGSSFTNTAHTDAGGYALKVEVGADGTVFLANRDVGLRAYTYDGSSFTNTAHIDDGGYAYEVAVGADGTVFLANRDDGLRAYTYDGSSFTNTAHINNGGDAWGVKVGADGTVFLANRDDGLRAYTYSGTVVSCIGDVTLSTQAEVDAFACNTITGNLTISGADIDDLSPLSVLTSLGGNLAIINSDALPNLDGLSGITSIPGILLIRSNDGALTNIDGLSSLTSIGGSLSLSDNYILENLDGLANLESIGGNLTIFGDSHAMTNINGLGSLTSVGGNFRFYGNLGISNVDSLFSLISVGGDLEIRHNSTLDKFCGLYNLIYGGGVAGDYLVHSNAYNPLEQDIIDAGPCVVLCANFTVQLKDSDGNLLAGGLLEYREGGSNGWQAATEIEDGLFCIDTEKSQLGLRMTYGPQVLKVSDVPTNTEYTFQMEEVMVKLRDNGVLTDNGEVHYTSDGWHYIGVTGDDGTGVVKLDMLPTTYTFRMNYYGDKELKQRTISPSYNKITFHVEDLKSAELSGAEDFQLVAYPNPFSGNTTIAFSLEEAREVNIAVYDQTGRLIKVLEDGMQTEGKQKINWDASGVDKGVYFVRLSSEGRVVHQNMIKM